MSKGFSSERITISLTGRTDQVSGEWYTPTQPLAIVTLGHGAGSNMDQPFLKSLAGRLAENGIAVLRFNFLYSENKKKMPDRFPVASAAILGAIKAATERFPSLPVFCSGKSFGGRMSSMTLAESSIAAVKGLIFFGFPLHPADTPSVDRAEHLSNIRIPMLFLQGTKDALAYFELISKVTAGLPSAALVPFEGADHSFNKGKATIMDQLVDESLRFIENNR
jgi:uncharacterized protein